MLEASEEYCDTLRTNEVKRQGNRLHRSGDIENLVGANTAGEIPDQPDRIVESTMTFGCENFGGRGPRFVG